jgi:cysteine desulfurase/selenocysteine lyase
MIDMQHIKNQFPQLQNLVYGKKLVYLDSAATSYKPLRVLEKIQHYYRDLCVNVHRAIHPLAEMATTEYETTRDSVAKWLNAKQRSEIIFTRGTTESINLIATVLQQSIKPGDEIVLTVSEHHSNLVPWQMLAEKTGATLKFIPLLPDGTLDLNKAKELITSKTKVVSLTYISNVLGFINPIESIISFAREYQAIIVLDAAQAAARIPIDVQKLDVDFLAFSAHKCFGPTSLGFLYGKSKLLEQLPPFMGGGDMIDHVTLEKTDYNVIPYKFEAGTPNIASAIAFNASLEFVNELGMEQIYEHEVDLTHYLYTALKSFDDLSILGDKAGKVGLVSFTLKGLHPQDIATFLGRKAIALRTGHLCAQPLLRSYGYDSVLRASLSIYNTKEDIDYFTEQLHAVIKLLRE